MCVGAEENQTHCCDHYGLRVQEQTLFLVCSTLVNRCISKGTRFFRYRYPLIGTRSVLVPVWSHWNSLRSVFLYVFTLKIFNKDL